MALTTQLSAIRRTLYSLFGLNLATTRSQSSFGVDPNLYEELDLEAYTVWTL
jgi:hypothetical protein